MLLQTQEQRLQAKADPQMILANALLNMSCLELTQAVQQEAADNPALEHDDEDLCSGCQAPQEQCAVCVLKRTDGYRNFQEYRCTGDEGYSFHDPEDDDIDPVSLAPEGYTLQDHLNWQIGAIIDEADAAIAEYLICNIDDGGYLRCDLSEAAEACHVSLDRVERVLHAVQSLDPPGVGARDPRECLLLQLAALRQDGADVALPECIVRDHWSELIAHRYGQMARSLSVPTECVERAVHFIRTRLFPYPGSRVRPSWCKTAHKNTPGVKPDVAIVRDKNGSFAVQVLEHEGTNVRVSPSYVRLWQEMQRNPRAYSEAERRTVMESLSRAQMFMRGMEQRKELLRKVAETILEEQYPFFLSESPEDLLPLTQSKIASLLHVHESTVSRGVADKYIQLPSGQVVSFRFFFGKALSAKHMVKVIVENEDPACPYSDQQISDILKSLGYEVARRTVLKYREELNILSSRQRCVLR